MYPSLSPLVWFLLPVFPSKIALSPHFPCYTTVRTLPPLPLKERKNSNYVPTSLALR